MAIYRGRKVTLNKPQRGGSKKSFVYVKDGNKVKKVSFGSKTMKIRKNNKMQLVRASWHVIDATLLDLKQKLGTGAVKLGVNHQPILNAENEKSVK